MSQYADWIHCTMCFKTPPLMGQIFFSSCGHVLCQKCGYNHDQNTTVNICPHCKAQVRCVPVDKNLSSDIKMYFRTPYDLATQFMQQLKKVLDFQSVNRQRLQKHNQEKTMKLHKYAEGAGGQLKKMQEAAKKLHQEKQQLLVEIQSCKQQIHELSQRCKIAEASLCDNARGGSDSGIGSLFSTDSSMNMSAVLTSTPIYGSSPVDPNLLNGSGGHKGVSIFGSANLSPISSDIFGGKNPPRRNSGSRPGRDFFS